MRAGGPGRAQPAPAPAAAPEARRTLRTRQTTNSRAVVPYARERTYTTAELHLFPVGAMAHVPRKARPTMLILTYYGSRLYFQFGSTHFGYAQTQANTHAHAPVHVHVVE